MCQILNVFFFLSNPGDIRLFAMFHSQTTKENKSKILHELASETPFMRIVFATTALGMGVNARHVRRVIHITPPSTLENYFQEVGRAGRDGHLSEAVLYYNNSDIHAKTHVSDEMRQYCKTDTCLRKEILSYFGYRGMVQDRCCSNCHPAPLTLFPVNDEEHR